MNKSIYSLFCLTFLFGLTECCSQSYIADARFLGKIGTSKVNGYFAIKPSVDCSTLGYFYLEGYYCDPTNPCYVEIRTYPVVNNDFSTVGPIYDPTNIASTPDVNDCSMDMKYNCQYGAISKKYGVVHSDPMGLTFNDYFITIYNQDSFIGRSACVSQNGTLLICATIERNSTYGVIRASAQVQTTSGIVNVIFKQEAGNRGSIADVTIFPPPATPTGWSIVDCTTNDLFAPYGSTNDTCSYSSQSNCAMGDLTTKLGRLNSTQASIFFTDLNINVQPSHPTGIIGKCVRFDDLNVKAPIIFNNTCTGNPLVLEASFTGASVAGTSAEGSIIFSQVRLGCPTTVTVAFTGLIGNHPYHVHQYPNTVPASTGGHFDPFFLEFVQNYACTSDNFGKCGLGDLSGKFGRLAATAAGTYSDYSLPLFGLNSIIYRPVVIHFSNSSRWLTAQILPKDQDIKIIRANYTPEGGSFYVTGNITFYQSAADTSAQVGIYIDARYVVGASGRVGEWHIHENGGDYDNWCIGTGGHYNPHEAGNGCIDTLAEFCAEGDFSAKHGRMYLPVRGTQKYMHTDFQVNLTAIEGKVIIIHNYDNTTIACAPLFDIVKGPPVAPSPYPSPSALPINIPSSALGFSIIGAFFAILAVFLDF
eukprot:c17759_g1_i1.p1 GENE.c17759_g1_i1~~c17759_g1_i1.p1  ORF type:complete len:645 (+),score=179.95 c17759_g1_i1:81-2015(+)